ncbi:VPA1262 family N-terminal domain-containing protein [Epibacterium ulvae]|uniref:VPA1262 family N-terminal domain-containing protein n=1 Tax=Epibacterium ulvae TaxID=1156985 RepID=UPI0024924B46|nr:VPA1262 family N-terminal domain-containing protein [Epibacterium ulvae]
MAPVDFPFEHAIVRFSCLQPKGARVPHLVFASVEFLPRGRAVPDETPLDDKGFPPSLPTKAGRLMFRRVALSAQAALDWYRRLNTLPDATGPHIGRALCHGPLADEPSWSDDIWPALVVPIPPSVFPGPAEDDRIDPFSGKNREAVRVHRRLSVGDPAVDALRDLAEEKKQKAFEWLRLRIWVDFTLYPEMLGSAVLIAPDPELRNLATRLDRDAVGVETIVAEPDWRVAPAKPLELVVREQRHGGLSLAKTFSLQGDDPVRIPRRSPVREIAWDVVHPDRGVIAAMPMTGFMRSIGLNSNLMGRKITIEGRDGRGKKAPSSSRVAQEVASVETAQVGTRLTPIGRLNEGAQLRRLRRAQASEFWLDEPSQARDVIHGILSKARNAITLVDPYADGLDLADYGAFSTGAKVRMLTAEQSTTGRAFVPLSKGITPLRELGRRVTVRRMSQNALHDRFLVVDRAVWFLGASLNGVGQQATMLVRLREARPVCKRLMQLWLKAAPIEGAK